MSENIDISNRYSKAPKGSSIPDGISQIEADLIFKKLTSQGRMDFDQFFKSMIIISQKIAPQCDPKTSIELLYNGKLQQIDDHIL